MAGNENVGEIAQAAAEAATTAVAATAAIEADAEIRVDAALAQVAAAEETADLIAQAALQTELGKRVAACETSVGTWEAKISSLETALAELMTVTLVAIQTTLAELKSAAPSVLIPVPALPLNAVTETIVPLATGENVDPTQANRAENMAPEPEPPQARRPNKKFT